MEMLLLPEGEGEDRHCRRCWPGEEEDDRCCCRLTRGRGGCCRRPLPPLLLRAACRRPPEAAPPLLSPVWLRGRLPWAGPVGAASQAWQGCSRPGARGLYIHTHSVLTQWQRPAPRAARRTEGHSSGRGPGGAVRHGAARARRVQAAGDSDSHHYPAERELTEAEPTGGRRPGGAWLADREALLRAGARWRSAPRCGPGPKSAGRG